MVEADQILFVDVIGGAGADPLRHGGFLYSAGMASPKAALWKSSR